MTEPDTRVEEALRAHLPALLAFLERRVDPQADAADVLSSAVEIIWRKQRQLPAPPDEARAWMFAIAINCLRNARRSHIRRSRATQRLRDHISVTTPSHTGGDYDHVQYAIDQLPDHLRELVRLVHWDGFTLTEVAQIIGTSASTARSRYARARTLLRSNLETQTQHTP